MKKINLHLKGNIVHPKLWRKSAIFGRTPSVWVYRFARVTMTRNNNKVAQSVTVKLTITITWQMCNIQFTVKCYRNAADKIMELWVKMNEKVLLIFPWSLS